MEFENEIVDFETSIGPWLGKTIKTIDYCLQEVLNNEGLLLTKEQIIVLKRLKDQDGLNQNELAFLTLRNKSSLTRLLIKMENKKYIIRKQSKTDKRVNNVFLSDLGREVFEKAKPVIKYMLETMEQNITKEEKDQTIEVLKKIQFNFNSKIESF